MDIHIPKAIGSNGGAGSLIETAHYHNAETGAEESVGPSSARVQAAAADLPYLAAGLISAVLIRRGPLEFQRSNRNKAVSRTLARLEQQTAAKAGQIAWSICALRRRTC
jgi:hypothetical protein